jgi:hypothetical protein
MPALPIGYRSVIWCRKHARRKLIIIQERRRVEELYVQGLRKLANRHPPDESSDLGYDPLSIDL